MPLTPSPTPLSHFSLLSFDVFGTLIDWEAGIADSIWSSEPFCGLPRSHPLRDRTTLLRAFEAEERQIQLHNPGQEYSEVLSEAYLQLCKEHGIATGSDGSDDEAAALQRAAARFGDSVGDWPAFPDTLPALRRLATHYRLVPLTNSSPRTMGASLAGPLQNFRFSAVYTAADIGSYKPDPRNFDHLIQHVRDEFGCEKDRILHVAQSKHHDHVPAAKVGLQRVWVDRQGAMGDPVEEATWNWEVRSLAELAELVEEVFRDSHPDGS